MDFRIPEAEHLGLFLGIDEVAGTRADFLLEKATRLCETVVKPLPNGAETVVLTAAARAYTNASGATYETIGPMSVQRPPSGLYLTKAEEKVLKRLSGRGGAFSIDPTPASADPSPTWPQDADGLTYEPGWGPV